MAMTTSNSTKPKAERRTKLRRELSARTKSTEKKLSKKNRIFIGRNNVQNPIYAIGIVLQIIYKVNTYMQIIAKKQWEKLFYAGKV